MGGIQQTPGGIFCKAIPPPNNQPRKPAMRKKRIHTGRVNENGLLPLGTTWWEGQEFLRIRCGDQSQGSRCLVLDLACKHPVEEWNSGCQIFRSRKAPLIGRCTRNRWKRINFQELATQQPQKHHIKENSHQADKQFKLGMSGIGIEAPVNDKSLIKQWRSRTLKSFHKEFAAVGSSWCHDLDSHAGYNYSQE